MVKVEKMYNKIKQYNKIKINLYRVNILLMKTKTILKYANVVDNQRMILIKCKFNQTHKITHNKI